MSTWVLSLTIMAACCCHELASRQLSVVETLAASYGYHDDTHDVVTPDGYILTVHRLSNPHAPNSSRHNTPVLINHALFTSSDVWMFRQDENIALQLVDHGFDVWLGNYRGSPYGRRHQTLKPNSAKFWDFSWHENGVMDQAAMIDYVLNSTGHALSVLYSMSCTATMVLLSERPEYNSKVIANVFFAPSAIFKNRDGLQHVAKALMDYFPRLTNLLKNVTGEPAINGKFPFSDVSLTTICPLAKQNTVLKPICKMLSDFFAGRQSYLGSHKLLRALTIQLPSGASVRQVAHYAQGIEAGKFRKYDFGRTTNLRLYGSTEPPSYNLKAITAPIHFFCGVYDIIASFKDCLLLSGAVPSTVSVNKVPRYDHFSFIIGNGLSEVVNKKVIAYFLSYV